VKRLALLALLPLAAAGSLPSAELPPPLSAGPLTSLLTPLPGAVRTQGFGCTSFAFEPAKPDCPGGHFHAGLDLAGPLPGTPVIAAAGGLVLSVVASPTGYGVHVVLDHGHGLTTLYAHLLQSEVAAGDLVGGGQAIGQLGSTGNSTGPHLHFEVRAGGRPADPELYLPAAYSRGGSP
jgi:murein DD-endopeptidase MepM/ murein hydrolase activator NlpD